MIILCANARLCRHNDITRLIAAVAIFDLYVGEVLTPAGSNPLYRRSIRVSMGTVFQVPWAFLEEENGIGQLYKMGFKTAAMALREDAVRIDAPQLMQEEKLAIVLGTEGEGLASDTIARCDYTVRIPMARGVDSLNVAAASAVAFWQLGGRT